MAPDPSPSAAASPAYGNLADEDLEMKERIDLYVERVQDSDPGVQKLAIESLRNEIRTATGLMTSVPQQLKFLRPHYRKLKEYFNATSGNENQKYLADVLSVLALTMSDEGERDCLQYRLVGSDKDVCSWGYEYVRKLTREIALERVERVKQGLLYSDLMELVEQIVPFYLKHNAEPEAVDLLMEVEDLNLLVEHVDSTNFKRTCSYLASSSSFLPSPGNSCAIEVAYTICKKFGVDALALQFALALRSVEKVKDVYYSTNDLLMKKQFSYILARQGLFLEIDEKMGAEENDREALQDIINNLHLSEGYRTLVRDLEVMAPKSPEEIYKEHLIGGQGIPTPNVDSASQNLAATFVNAFVNAGFCQDKLMTIPVETSSGGSSGSWIFKNKEHRKTSATASLGMILLWDVDSGLAQIDKYLHSDDNHVVSGALLGIGIVNCGVKSVCDPALALLVDYINNDDVTIRIGAIMGLGIAYAGSNKDELKDHLSPILLNPQTPLELLVFTAITLSLVYIGSCNEEIAQHIIHALMVRSENEMDEPLARLLPVALGLLYLGKEKSIEASAEVSKTFKGKMQKYCDITLLSLAYAGTGNVLKVQKLLGYCSQHLEMGETYQGSAVLGIGLVAMSEQLGLDMAIRSLEKLLQSEQPNVRRAVPLALSILCVSNPKVNVMDTLSRLTHDSDSDVSQAAIISLGFIGAGTNNARIAAVLRNLSSYYSKEAGHLFCVRIAQGLVHMGKGLQTLSPYHADRFLLSQTALAGLVVVLHACLDLKSIILGKYHSLLYMLVLAMQPRMLLTVDEELKPLSVYVRVGKAVDVIGQAGRPKTITGSQTHSTPVLLAAGERAELATEKYIPLSPVLEGFVILRKNPDYDDEN